MVNPSIENLGRIVESGNTEEFMGEGTASMELRAQKEARTQGLDTGPTPVAGTTFSDVLRKSVENVNEMQIQADTAVKELVAGRSKNIHETMLSVERADTSLKLMMQVRNKILDAYREIMRMQV